MVKLGHDAIVVMGVSGCGKTTIGAALAQALGYRFLEGDDFHPPANVQKMASGQALSDADRLPFLHGIVGALQQNRSSGVVVSCSALKRSYRDLLRAAGPLTFIHLAPSAQALAERLTRRTAHYMPASLLDSQLAALEPLDADEKGLTLSGDRPVNEQLRHIYDSLGTSQLGEPSMIEPNCDIGIIGLAVMGENLALNMANKGHAVAVYNRSAERTRAFATGRANGKAIVATTTLPDFVSRLRAPRKIMMLVKAGEAVDDLLKQLTPLLAKGDILIDGGNTYFADTTRRAQQMQTFGLRYVGSGVSGGEEGALTGPSLMPGGNAEAWPFIKPIFESICARTPGGEACCSWIGADGSGHFVKMVHNGIEYGDMQIIAESYDLLRRGLAMSNAEMATVFADWNSGELNSYLIDITARILDHRDNGGQAVLDAILDTAGQKGTGKWMVGSALDHGVPLTLITESVFARTLAANKELRVAAAQELGSAGAPLAGDRAAFIADLRQALYASKIVSYAQGFQLLAAASKEYNWQLNFGAIAQTWRGGCIIRSAFLDDIKAAYEQTADLPHLLLAPKFKQAIQTRDAAWRRVVIAATHAGIAAPCLGAALTHWDALRTERSPANLLQAQRDFFGAHNYERTDRPRGEFFHTDWTGKGGTTTSQTYTK
jgi:6-phosphogluconate dehydrogenase